MFTFVIAQKLGLVSDLILALSLLEGVFLTVALMLLAERYLFSTAPITSSAPIGPGADTIGVPTGEARSSSGSPTQA